MNAISNPAPRALDTRPITLIEGGTDAVPVLVHGVPTPRDSVEGFLLSRIDGEKSIAELAALAGLTAREVLHVVTALVLEGCVVVGSCVPPPVAPERRSDPRVDPSTPEDDFVSFRDVFDELELE